MELRVADLAPHLTVVVARPTTHLMLQGCSRACPGCFNPEFQSRHGGRAIGVAQLADSIAVMDDDVLMLSGGEPFDQARSLHELCRLLRAQRPQFAVVAYSGYRLAELAADKDKRALLRLVDVLIDGPFDAEYPADDGIRGSLNQSVHAMGGAFILTDLGRPPELRYTIRAADGACRLYGFPPVGGSHVYTHVGVRHDDGSLIKR